MRANLVRTLAPIVLGTAALAVAVAVVWRVHRRRMAQAALPGAGDDKPPGYENPTTPVQIAGHDPHSTV